MRWRGGAMKPLDQCRLYTFIDTAFLRGRAAAAVAEQLCRGGSDLIQLRAKDCSPEQVRQLAGEIQPVLRRAGVGLVINDHWDLAREIGADFCHLGQEDFFDAGFTHVSQLSALPPRPLSGLGAFGVREPRQRAKAIVLFQSAPAFGWPSPPLLGLSTHAPEQAARALAAGPAYLAIGPVYATATKPGAQPVTLEYVRWAAAQVKIPWFAIGGINLENLEEVLRAGAQRICVVSAILNAPDIAQACREFKKRMEH